MKVITNDQGLMETVDSENETEVECRQQAAVRRLRAELRGMLDGHVQFHVDPYVTRAVDTRPALKWIPWNQENLDKVGWVLIHCRDFHYHKSIATDAKFPDESFANWDEFCVAAPGTEHYAEFDLDRYQP